MTRDIRLVLGGSGTNFFAYIGALKYIHYQCDYNIKEVIGVSGGSLVGSLFCAGYTPRQIEKIVCSIDFNSLLDKNILPIFYSQGYGLIKGNKILSVLNEYLPSSFKDLKIDLYVLITSVLSKSVIVVSKLNDIGLTVSESVRCSISIPNLFSFYQKNNNIYIDGGIFNNYPVDLKTGIKETIAIKADSKFNANGEIKNIFHYNSIIIDCLLESRKLKSLEDSSNTKHIQIFVNNDGYDLNISKEKKLELIKAGYEQTKKVLNKYV
jgi:NTE family protein